MLTIAASKCFFLAPGGGTETAGLATGTEGFTAGLTVTGLTASGLGGLGVGGSVVGRAGSLFGSLSVLSDSLETLVELAGRFRTGGCGQ